MSSLNTSDSPSPRSKLRQARDRILRFGAQDDILPSHLARTAAGILRGWVGRLGIPAGLEEELEVALGDAIQESQAQHAELRHVALEQNEELEEARVRLEERTTAYEQVVRDIVGASRGVKPEWLAEEEEKKEEEEGEQGGKMDDADWAAYFAEDEVEDEQGPVAAGPAVAGTKRKREAFQREGTPGPSPRRARPESWSKREETPEPSPGRGRAPTAEAGVESRKRGRDASQPEDGSERPARRRRTTRASTRSRSIPPAYPVSALLARETGRKRSHGAAHRGVRQRQRQPPGPSQLRREAWWSKTPPSPTAGQPADAPEQASPTQAACVTPAPATRKSSRLAGDNAGLTYLPALGRLDGFG